MVRRYSDAVLAFVLFTPISAMADTVATHEIRIGQSGYACGVTLNGVDGARIGINLSDDNDDWRLIFYVSGIAQRLGPFFDQHGLVDRDKLERTVTEVRIGSRAFSMDKVSAFFVQKSELDAKATITLEIELKPRVVSLLNAMSDDGMIVAPLVEMGSTREGLSEFQTCAFDAMGATPGASVQSDGLGEMRLLFEKAFSSWVRAMARADVCSQGRFDETKVDDVVTRASAIFYPGLTNWFKQDDYADDLRGEVPFSKLDGITEAQSVGCLGAGQLADMWLTTVEKVINIGSGMD